MGLKIVVCVKGDNSNCDKDQNRDYDREHDRDNDRNNDGNRDRNHNRDHSKDHNRDGGKYNNEDNSTINYGNNNNTAVVADEATPSQITNSNTTNSTESNTTNSTGSIPDNSTPTSSSQSNLTNTQSTQSIQSTQTSVGSNNSAANTSLSTETDKITGPFDSNSPFLIPIIIGIVIIALIILVISYCLLKKTVFKKRYDLPSKGYILHGSMGENEPGINWKTSSFDSDAEIQSPTIAITSNRSSIVRIDQLINIDLNEDNDNSNISDVQDFLEPARRSSAFLDYPNNFYRSYVESELTLENFEHETIQRPPSAFI
ncbi:hypothetical protein F8M41_016809 [Gigaspora margarita]|uniref:Uncharacterized protein n=1 Tax=Gigaspora margarita TaxID=4874 RepID=A0A8H4AP27_GIGMA|nr:hypothetical protein F8M41_016809 [Gigaspora margarita]